MSDTHTVFSTMTPTEASQVFNMKVDYLTHSTGLPFATAFERAKLENKDLWARVKEGNKPVSNENRIQGVSFNVVNGAIVPVNDSRQTALSNEGIPSEPVFGPEMRKLLGLPGDSDAQENSAAWRATKGCIVGPNGRDSKAIWRMLFALWSGRMADKSAAAVELFMKSRFPLLAQDVFANPTL